MGAPPVFNLDVLLAPISPTAPAGIDPRLDSAAGAVYFALKDARAAARALERQADSDDEAATPIAQWQAVFDLATRLLREQAKDLEVTAWLIEASLRLHGFAGLRDGFDLALGLIDRYWDVLFPAPDEEGVAIRVSALGGLNGLGSEGTLIQAIRKVPLTEAIGNGPYAYWHYTLANRPPPPAVNGRPGPGPRVTLDEITEAARQSDTGFMRDLADDLADARGAFRELSQRLDERCGEEAPPSSTINNVLEDVATAIGHLTNELGLATVAPVGAIDLPAVPTPEAATAPEAHAGPIASREEAFRKLNEIAEFFRRTEPHSPLSYTIEDVVRRGRMSFQELLVELLPDQGARNIFLTTAGIKPKQDN